MKENFTDYSKYDISVIDLLLIRAIVISRHSGPNTMKIYAVFILCDKSNSDENTIVEHFCQLKSGSRTIGCCSHIMAIVW